MHMFGHCAAPQRTTSHCCRLSNYGMTWRNLFVSFCIVLINISRATNDIQKQSCCVQTTSSALASLSGGIITRERNRLCTSSSTHPQHPARLRCKQCYFARWIGSEMHRVIHNSVGEGR
jgi:hypothetical protein